MIKYVEVEETFAEIPDEITLCINISNCPCHCEGCHSPHLAQDIGIILNEKTLENLIESHRGITCVAFMGGDTEPYEIYKLCKFIQFRYPNIKRAWYSGRQELPDFLKDCYNGKKLQRYSFIKLGPYIKEKGPLNDPNTNQIMYEVNRVSELQPKFILSNITYKFWKND